MSCPNKQGGEAEWYSSKENKMWKDPRARRLPEVASDRVGPGNQTGL